jgi:hypothetical protein
VTQTVLHRRGTTLVRRLCLEPGEPTRWHRDPCHRLTLVLRGADLAIKYRDGDPAAHIELLAGRSIGTSPSTASTAP